MEPTAMDVLLTNVGSVFTTVIGWLGDIATCITSNPVLLLPIGFLVIGFAVGIFSRLLSVR